MIVLTKFQTRPYFFLVWLLLATCTTMLCASRVSGDDKTVRDDFAKQYNPHANDLQKFYTNFEAKCVNIYHFPDGKKMITTYGAKSSGVNFLLGNLGGNTANHKPEAPSTEVDTVDGGNTRYDFSLTKKGSDLFVINSAKIHRGDKPIHLCYLIAPVAGCLFDNQFFSKMSNDESVRFLEFEDCLWKDKAAKKLKLQIVHHYGSSMSQVADMVVAYYFSPVEGWICCGMQGYEAGKTSPACEEIYYPGKKVSHLC